MLIGILLFLPSVFAQVCAPGSYGTAYCTPCPAGTFAYFRGSTVCQPCPANTGSAAGATVCVSCGVGCRLQSGAPCPDCNSSCTACKGGTYNDGSMPRCKACPAGSFSTVTQAVSVDSCGTCDAGMSMYPSDAGKTVCTDCALLNQPIPLNAQYVSGPDPLVCTWECSAGYLRVNYSEAGFAGGFVGYTPTQALALFHITHDYCCNPTLSVAGTYLSGCSRTFDGVPVACAPVPNAYFFVSPDPKINRCADWACNADYYSDGTTCIPQPVCLPGYTYQRDTAGNLVANAIGSYQCVPCSLCMDGSELFAPCNRTQDTRCRLCSAASFSRSGSACVSPVPLGYLGVVVRLSSIPVYQGRPAVFSDGTAIAWTNINFGSGFFIRTFTPCQPIPPSYAYTGNDPPCSRLDTAQACKSQICSIQCRAWNGTAGWFMLKTGACTPCVYDTTCSASQYSDMTVCGPYTAPQCRECPSALLPNALAWVNPGRITYPPCDFVCRDGYVKFNNTCVFCPSLPDNAKVIGGCDWVCSLGFLQSGSQCVPCTGVPTSCGIGAYVGYPDGAQCARCLPCSNRVDNSVYISAGTFNGPNTCMVRCNPGTFADPLYGLDAQNNPVVCRPCSAPQCAPGESYLVACSYLSDAQCAPCTQCAPGSRVLKPCTIGADAVCTPCDVGSLPANASWTTQCSQWECDQGFFQNNTVCARCKQPSDCQISDRFIFLFDGCGACSPCNASLLLPGQCFNGDGQCGATYRCGRTTTARQRTTTVTTTPRPTTTPYPTTTATPSMFASIVTLTLPSNATLANLTQAVNCYGCTVRVLSVSGHRRLLSDTVTVELAIISQQPNVNMSIAQSLRPVAMAATDSYLVPNATTLNDNVLLSIYIKTMEAERHYEPPVPWILMGASLGAVLVCVVLLCVAFAGAKKDVEYQRAVRWPAMQRP